MEAESAELRLETAAQKLQFAREAAAVADAAIERDTALIAEGRERIRVTLDAAQTVQKEQVCV